MMTEAQAKAYITEVCTAENLSAYKLVRLEANGIAGNFREYEAQFAIIVKDGVLEESFVKAMMLKCADVGGNLVFDGSSKRMEDLDSEVMIISATIKI